MVVNLYSSCPGLQDPYNCQFVLPLEIPISIILGDKDRLVDLKAVDEFANEVPSEVFTISEGGHFLFFEQPDELSNLIAKII